MPRTVEGFKVLTGLFSQSRVGGGERHEEFVAFGIAVGQ